MDKRALFLVGILGAAPAALNAADAPAKFVAEAAARVIYDSNVFLQDGGPLLAGATTSAPAREGAWVTSTAAGVAWIGRAGDAGKLELGYRAEVFRFDGLATENHDDHRVRAALAGARGAATWDVAVSELWTNGAHLAPLYNVVGGGPAIGGEPVRARRSQSIFKGSARLTVKQTGGWWRAMAAGLAQDFHTGFASGCASYVDRAEYSAGAEFARELRPGLAWVIGARAGRQEQKDRPPTVALNSTNDLVRVLAGVEGRLSPQWKIDLRAGPDFRRFTAAQPAALGRSRVPPYVEAAIAWTPDAADTVSLSGLHRLWPASSGRGVYEDSTWELGWKHAFDQVWALRAAQKFADADNHRDAYPGTKAWHDQILTTTCAAEYRWSKHVVLDAAIAREAGEGLLPNTPGRAYTRVLCSLGATGSW
ncbi:MAG: hypothetical protein KF715_03480 [Candidatus Didemnitutus sp.]|nr:hypothetical protein [Candidatus Didemnitutus sp.]